MWYKLLGWQHHNQLPDVCWWPSHFLVLTVLQWFLKVSSHYRYINDIKLLEPVRTNRPNSPTSTWLPLCLECAMRLHIWAISSLISFLMTKIFNDSSRFPSSEHFLLAYNDGKSWRSSSTKHVFVHFGIPYFFYTIWCTVFMPRLTESENYRCSGEPCTHFCQIFFFRAVESLVSMSCWYLWMFSYIQVILR